MNNALSALVCLLLASTPVAAVPPRLNSQATVDGPGALVGIYSSLALGADGFPVISYNADGILKVAKCANAACTSRTVSVVDSSGPWGAGSSIRIGGDGLPLIVYSAGSQNSTVLKAAKCANAACTTSSVRTVDSTPGVGWYSSMVFGADGFPVISYQDYVNGTLKVVKCAIADGSAVTATTTVDSDKEYATSIALGADAVPVMSYKGVAALKVAKCANAACTGTSTITQLDGNGDFGFSTSIAIGTDGLPIVSYNGTSALKVAKCTGTACNAAAVTTVDSGSELRMTSIAIGAGGLPVLSYYDLTLGDLKVAKCGDAACGTSTVTRVAAVGDVGRDTSIAVASDGLPVISHYANGNALKVVKCATASCEQEGIVVRYRLYYPGTNEHLYTTQLYEYLYLSNQVTPECCGWNPEGPTHYVFPEAVTHDGVATLPYLRLYNPYSKQHHWTTDQNEYDVLPSFGWQQEGIDGHILPSPASGAVPLYRLYINASGGLHLWTTDANEVSFLTGSQGWTAEGIAGYVVPLP